MSKEVNIGFFQEDVGVNSAMRLNTSLAIWVGLAILLLTAISKAISLPVDAGTNVTIGFGLVGGGLGFKLGQKMNETKNNT